MKKLIYFIIIWGFGISGYTQNTYPAENAKLCTDRAFYISGEEIQFSGWIFTDSSNEIFSEVVYVELLDPLGQKINQQKYYLNENGFQGKISIPESLISGYYNLRAYTKYMRNGSADAFPKVALKIVNPFLIEVQQLPDSLYLSEKRSKSIVFFTETPLKKKYKIEEEIQINIRDLEISEYAILNLAIIPSGTQHFIANPSYSSSGSYKRIQYYPETRGLSLSGSVMFNGQPSAYHLVYVNIMGEQDFISAYSDSAGKFNIALPIQYHFQELMIGAANKDAGKTELLIDNDFESETGSLKVQRFFLSQEEEKLTLQLAKQYQINKWYYDSLENQYEQKACLPFYQQAFKVIDFDFYIPLDSLQLYFTDIPSFVQVKKRKGKRYFQLIGEETALAVYKPLVLVDWIPVDEADRVLAMNPSNVKKIEVLNRIYYHGNKLFGGIIHIITREGKMGDLKFPDANIYLNYQFPQPEISEVKLEFPITHYWNVLYDNETDEISIKTPQLMGAYILLIQQIDKDGTEKMIHIPFDVGKD
jgi:hypothetical protein